MHDRQQKQEREPQLFGTLLASRPARTRSPIALGISIAVHAALLVLLLLVSRPFVPRLAHKLFDVTIIVPEDAPVTIHTTPPAKVAGVPQRPTRRPARAARAQPNQPLVYTPGPIAPIAAPTPGPETPEPSDNPFGGNASLADRLRPAVVDPRLNPRGNYVLPPTASPADAVRMRIAQALQEYNDSLASENEAHRRALDWTFKTKDGKQWGISPDGKLHLGDVTIPIPVAFTAPPGKRDEINARNRAWAEIEMQANREIARQTVKDRVKAIRERKDKEREEKRKAGVPITN